MKHHIVYSSSDAYAICTGISIYSLLKNNQDLEDIVIYVITTDMTEVNRKKIEAVVKGQGAEVHFVNASEILKKYAERLNLKLFRGSYNVYATLILHEIFPDVDKLLSIDSDTLVTGSLKELWNVDMSERLLAIVPEVGLYGKISTSEDYEVLFKNPVYYNCGIMFFNLSNWRKENVSDKIANAIDEYKDGFKIVDQSIINYTLYDKIERLHLRYNYYTAVHGIKYKTMCKNFPKKEIFKEKEFTEAKEKPAIIHFVGQPFERPWYKKSATPYKKMYLEYWAETPWKDEMLLDNPKEKSFVFGVYDKISYFLRKLGMYNIYHWYRYVLGQQIKMKLNEKR